MKRLRSYQMRQLRPDQPTPTGTPRRYRNSAGYVRLRWLVDTQTYVEVYEHRLNAGMPDESMHVHHINGIKDDNRPENLLVLTPQEHGRLHEQIEQEKDPMRGKRFGGYRSRHAQEKAERAKARRAAREERANEMRREYEAGMSTVELGQKYNLSAGNVSRWLRVVGTPMRRRATDPVERVRQVVKSRALLRCEACGRSLAYEPCQVHHRRPRAMGGSSRPETNEPQNLLHTCIPCHRTIEERRDWALGQGFLVRQYHDPAERPVKVYGHGWVYLSPGGRYVPAEAPVDPCATNGDAS